MQMKNFDTWAGAFPDVCFSRPVDLGIVLGSGWGAALEMDEVIARVSYADIPQFGASTVPGHAGEFILYRRHGKLIAAFAGRRHYYEGVGFEKVVFPIEILRRLGCNKVLLTNAAGGINSNLKAGDFVILNDHLNLLGTNPLIGVHVPEWGPRFPDMTGVYTKRFREILHGIANRRGYRAMEGVYACLPGPCYETPAEIRAYKTLGADVVGMSTVPEAILAKSIGFQVAAVSLVSNLAAGISPTPLSHEEVIEASEEAKPKLKTLIDDFIALF